MSLPGPTQAGQGRLPADHARCRPCLRTSPSSRAGPSYHRVSRQLVRCRTSAHWWEDEDEFDGVAGEVLLPKTLHILSLPESCAPAPPLDVPPTPLPPPQPCSRTSMVAAAIDLMRTGTSATFTAGFCSPQCVEAAQAVWEGLGVGGPPLFKKMRRRESLALTMNPEASDTVLSELLGQNWRVELDYGLGKDLEPKEHLLLVAHGHEVRTLLGELLGNGDSQDTAQDVGFSPDLWNNLALVTCDVRGTSDVQGGTSEGGKRWRDLQPKLTNVCSRRVTASH